MLAGAVLATELFFGGIAYDHPTPAFSAMLTLEKRSFATDGVARIKCDVHEGGSVGNCVVEEESPPHAGLGPAALALAPLYKMLPKQGDSSPTVTIPTRFDIKGPVPSIPVALLHRPSAEEIEARRPAGSTGGQVLVFCQIATAKHPIDGTLFDCNGVLEGTANRRDPLVKAALTLAATLQVDPAAYRDVPAPLRIDIIVHWPRTKP